MTGRVLHHEAVGDDGERWLYVLHGIYGAGRNWRSVARRLVRSRPEWRSLLVDLRMHGQSRGFDGPHTLAACASDLERLERSTARPASALLGHSFGGKVVLEALRRRKKGQAVADGTAADGAGADAGGAGRTGRRQAWVVDSTPSAREPGGSAVRMLRAVRALPGRFASREDAVEGLEERGFARPVARWMTTNLERDDGGFRWALDWSAMEELLEDFFRRDLWPVLAEPPRGWEVHVVKAEASAVLGEEACDRIERLGRRSGRVRLHRLDGGHWLNADAPDAVVELLAGELP